MFDPKTFPAAISPWAEVEDRMEIVNSGRLVVNATRRNPTAREEILRNLEILVT